MARNQFDGETGRVQRTPKRTKETWRPLDHMLRNLIEVCATCGTHIFLFRFSFFFGGRLKLDWFGSGVSHVWVGMSSKGWEFSSLLGSSCFQVGSSALWRHSTQTWLASCGLERVMMRNVLLVVRITVSTHPNLATSLSLSAWRPSLLGWLEAIALRLEAIASRLEAIARRLEAIASRFGGHR